MALSSPGTQITIIDESQYLPAAPNSIPLVVIATAQNKINASGTGVAAATTKANAGKLYAVTSQRDLITYFGNPFFYKTTSGTSIQGYELNEYGLLSAYSVLGSTNLVYAIRADIDLAALVGKTSRPSSSPDNGSWWLNTDSSEWGIFEFDSSTGSFTNKKPIVITDTTDLTSGVPKASLGNVGDYAVVLAYVSGAPDDYSTYWHKIKDYTTTPTSTKWVAVGSTDWLYHLQTVTGTATNPVIGASTAGTIVIGTDTSSKSTVTGVINNGISATVAGTTLTVTSVPPGTSIAVGTIITGTGVSKGTYVTALGTGTGGVGTYTVSQSQLVGTKVATVTGGIALTNSYAAAGNKFFVSSIQSGTLEVGTYLSGTSNQITAGSFVSGAGAPTYTIASVGTTDWTAIGATGTASMTGFSGNGGGTDGLTNVQLVVTAVTSGSLVAGRYISGTNITAGTNILSQLYNWTVERTYVSGGAAGSNTIVLDGPTGVAAGQLVLAIDSAGARRNGIPTGTTVTAFDAATNTVTLSNNITVSATSTPTADKYQFYTPVSTTVTANGGKGIYKISEAQNATSGTITGQPAVGATFTANGAGSGDGKATLSIAPGTYITGITTDGSEYTVNISQLVGTASAQATVTGYQNDIVGTSATAVTISNGNTLTHIKDKFNTANIPFLRTSSINNVVNLYLTKVGGSITVAGDLSTLEAVFGSDFESRTYNAPSFVYGTNAAQPLWRTTDSNPHPTGSVWVKTNSNNNGMNLVLSQYSTATGTFTNKTVTVAANDQTVNNNLDSTGGKAIPLNTVYAQVGFNESAPVQLFYRAQSGASVFTGTVSSPTGFDPGSQLWVRVSQPGSSTMLVSDSVSYLVTLPTPSPTRTLTASDFVAAWTSANIPYTKCELDSVTGAIVLTHTEGGIINLFDNVSTNANPAKVSPLVTAGFSVYDMTNSTGTLGAKNGPYKTISPTSYAGLATTGGTGAGLTVTLSTLGYTPTFTVLGAGTTYTVGDVLAVSGVTGWGGATFQIKVTAVDGSGGVTAVAWESGLATPSYGVTLSAWEPFDYVTQSTTPVNQATDGTPWFFSVVNQVDIMVNVGGVWKGYQNALYDTTGVAYSTNTTGSSTLNATGPIVSASEPTAQTNGNNLVQGDLWIDTSDLENYPIIKRWEQVSGTWQWVLLDNTDQQTEKGVLFADARWGADGSVDPVNDSIPTIKSLLTSDYVDLDAPDATTHPQGMLLFNTRRSGYNVKEFKTNYFTQAKYTEAGAYDANNKTDITNLPDKSYTWVTASGLKSNGSPYMGRKAQRAMVVAALKTAVDTSSELREEATSFNLIAAPGYPELQPNMVTLNNDRNNTAYIIGDTPLRLENDANAITKWATNAAGATATGEDGLVGRNTYLGIYYPSGITTDLTGAEVVVPASHMMLRTMVYNDKVAYPWFAPAGMRRGIIDNATNIGYIDAASGEFQTTKNRVALRDVQYTNFINPIAYFQNVGLLNYGNKNSYDSQSALDRTNVARLICYIRDRLQVAVRPFLFEPNDTMTRSQIKDVVSSLFADIKAKRGIYDYLVVCDTSNNTAARIDRNELWIDVAIEPVKAVEFIYIPVRIMNTGEIATGGK